MINSEEWLKTEGKNMLPGALRAVRQPANSEGVINRVIAFKDLMCDADFFQHTSLAIGQWALRHNITLLAEASGGVGKVVAQTARDFRLPCLYFHNQDGRRVARIEGDAQAVFRKGDRRVGVIHNLLTTGLSVQRFVANNLAGIPVRALAIIDCGQDIPGVRTGEEVAAFRKEHPDLPSPHVAQPFELDAFIEYPLALYNPPRR